MATPIGISNGNSQHAQMWQRDISEALLDYTPPASAITQLENKIYAIAQMRDWYYRIGDLPQARLHAIRIGNVRAALRKLKGETS